MEKINNACLLVKIMPRVNIICEIKMKNLIQFLSSFPHTIKTLKNFAIVDNLCEINLVFDKNFLHGKSEK